MKNLASLSLLIILVSSSCSKDDEPELTDWRIIETNTNLDIKGVNEINGELSIFGNAPLFKQSINYFSSAPATCLVFRDHIASLIEPIETPVYTTLSSDQRTWQAHNTFKTNIMDVQFINQKVGFVQTQLEGLFKTTNAGTSWTQILQGSIVSYCDGLLPLHIDKINFRNENEGYAIDDENDFVLKTIDGGENWEVFAGGANDPATLIRGIFLPPGSEAIYWRTGLYGGYRKSLDGGVSWFSTETDTRADDIQFLNNEAGFFVKESDVYKTIDGGNSWTKVNPEFQRPSEGALPVGNGFSHLTVMDQNILYVHYETISSKGIYRSLDGGLTFETLTIPQGAVSIKGIFPAPSGQVYAYGANGLLMVLR